MPAKSVFPHLCGTPVRQSAELDGVGEARALLAAARAWLEELSEEGVEALPRPEAPQSPEVMAPKAAPPVSPPEPTETPLIRPASTAGWGEGVTLEEVRERLGDCRRCELCEKRNQIVFGDGNPDADLMFVGEGPGADEDAQGIPFVGRAGQLLTRMIENGLEIPRSEVYICNIVKCRPPNNRTPRDEEAQRCREFLDGQIAAVKPRVIVALGKPATSLLLGRPVAITQLRGRWQSYGDIPVMPTFHPAFVLRQYTAENRRNVWNDLRQALERTRS